ncbi:MAG: DUF3365 domain-containing protein [Sedimenticola sp.]
MKVLWGYPRISGYRESIYIKKACLKCHGDPKGELDIAGKVKEGYEIGDLRGAISISMPVNY